MSSQLMYLLILLSSLFTFVSLLGAIFFWLRKKRNAAIVCVAIFALFAILGIVLAIFYYFVPGEAVITAA